MGSISGAGTLSWQGGAPATASFTATGTQTITIANQLTIIDGVTTQATANQTLVLSIGAFVKSGAIIHLARKTAATETLTFSTGITDVVNTGATGKTFAGAYIYNGTTFYPMGELQQVD